jgi:hypothetical protein
MIWFVSGLPHLSGIRHVENRAELDVQQNTTVGVTL